MLEYYLIHPCGDRDKVTVLEYNVMSCDLNDWMLLSTVPFTEPKNAILEAKRYASSNGITYETFESRYTNQTEYDILNDLV